MFINKHQRIYPPFAVHFASVDSMKSHLKFSNIRKHTKSLLTFSLSRLVINLYVGISCTMNQKSNQAHKYVQEIKRCIWKVNSFLITSLNGLSNTFKHYLTKKYNLHKENVYTVKWELLIAIIRNVSLPRAFPKTLGQEEWK